MSNLHYTSYQNSTQPFHQTALHFSATIKPQIESQAQPAVKFKDLSVKVEDLNEKKEKKCTNCQTNTTTLWRQNEQHEILCNACGLYLRNYQTNRPLHLVRNHDISRRRWKISKVVDISCSNCGVQKTSIWRRDNEGQVVCNACGLHERIHNRKRTKKTQPQPIPRKKRKSETKQSDCDIRL